MNLQDILKIAKQNTDESSVLPLIGKQIEFVKNTDKFSQDKKRQIFTFLFKSLSENSNKSIIEGFGSDYTDLKSMGLISEEFSAFEVLLKESDGDEEENVPANEENSLPEEEIAEKAPPAEGTVTEETVTEEAAAAPPAEEEPAVQPEPQETADQPDAGQEQALSPEEEEELWKEEMEKKQIAEHAQQIIDQNSDMPTKPFLSLFEESNLLFQDMDNVSDEDDDVPEGRVKLRIKTSKEIVIVDKDKGKILIDKSVAIPFTENKTKVVKELYEEKYKRFMEIAKGLFDTACNGDKHSLELLVSLIANKMQLANDKPTAKSYVARQTLIDYPGSELIYLIIKLMTNQHKMKPENPNNIGQKSKCDALNPHFQAKAREVIKMRIPATFRRTYVEKYEGRIVRSSQKFQISKDLNTLTRPSKSGYQADPKQINELKQKDETLAHEIGLIDEELNQIDLKVKTEMEMIRLLKSEWPGNEMLMNDLVKTYEMDYFEERDNYIESRKAKEEEDNKYFASPEDVFNKYKSILLKENVLENMEAEQLENEANEMVRDFFLFGGSGETILGFLHSIVEGVQDDLALVVTVDAVGKLLSLREELEGSKGFSENVFGQVWDGIGTLLYVIVKEGKGLPRVHAYAAIARVGHLHKFEVEKLWYEDFIRTFKYESALLKNDPFLDEFIHGMMEGAERLVKINTNLFQMKRKTLHNEIIKQVNIAQKKSDKLVADIYKNLAKII